MSTRQVRNMPKVLRLLAALASRYRAVLREVSARYSVVLILILLDYLAISLQNLSAWGRVIVTAFSGTTLLIALRAAHARRIWLILGALYLLVSTGAVVLAVVTGAGHNVEFRITSVGSLLIIVAPIVIVRDVARRPVVSVETILGAICVYLLLGISFAVVYGALAALGPQPFFIGTQHPIPSDFLFFSFTTLTTVGYGNLVPLGSVGQTFAMLEALFGQIYLVIVVARLVSLWGQQNPRASRREQPAPSEPEQP
jgi:hypothetical protein